MVKNLNGSMVLSKLKWHLSINHGHVESKDQNYLKQINEHTSKQAKYVEKKITVSNKAQLFLLSN